MKKEIHPKYFKNAKVKCSCGANFEVGSTIPEIKVEICSACHPLYTGNKKLVDTAGRVDRFQARLKKSQVMKAAAEKRQNKKSEKSESSDVPNDKSEVGVPTANVGKKSPAKKETNSKES